VPHRKNFLLNRLEPGLLSEIEPHLSVVELNASQILAETHQRIEKVTFPIPASFPALLNLRRRRNRDRHDR